MNQHVTLGAPEFSPATKAQFARDAAASIRAAMGHRRTAREYQGMAAEMRAAGRIDRADYYAAQARKNWAIAHDLIHRARWKGDLSVA